MAPNKKALGANSGGLFTREIWRARRDSNPRPPDPKSGSRQSQQLESIRAWNGHRKDAVFVDSGVSLDPAPERVLVPSRECERVRCPRLDRLFFKCPRRHSELYASTLEPSSADYQPIERSSKAGLRRSGRRFERSQPAPTDLNVPLRLECEVGGRERWFRAAVG